MANIWYSSDPHFFHENIITFCNRPFKNAEEMNETLIANHNALVRPSDHFWCLGDLCMGRAPAQAKVMVALVKRLNGHKRLIMGNHDQFSPKVYLEAGFEKIKASHRHDNMLFTHIPVHRASLGKAKANVHGHIHNNQGKDFPAVMTIDKESQIVQWTPYINISVEVTNYRPVDLDWIRRKVEGL